MDSGLIQKSASGDLVDVTPGRREVVAVISTGSVDRDNEVVLPSGLVPKNHQGMTVFYDHDTKCPLGTMAWVKAGTEKVIGKYRFSDKTQFARDMFALAQDGVVTTHSIGFTAKDYGPPTAAEISKNATWKSARRIYRSWDLLEFSLVGVPANPEAVSLAISKGICAETIARLKRGTGDADADSAVHSHSSITDLNSAGDAHARALIAERKIERTAAWSFDAADEDAMLRGHAGDWASYGRCFLGVDHMAGNNTKGRYKYPVVKNGRVYISALRAAISRAGQMHATGIESAARALLAAAEARKSAAEYVTAIARGLR